VQEFLLTISGIDPYMQHNDRLGNPLDPFKQAIAEKTSIVSKSEADHWSIARLEFDGGLHHDEVDGAFRVYIPASQPFAAMYKAAKTRRLGSKLKDSAIIMAEDGGLRIPLEFDAPWNGDGAPPTEEALELLWNAPDDKYRDMRMVGVDNMGKKRKVLRTRPRFPLPWSARFVVALEDSVLDVRKFESIATHAGRFVGIGEAPEGVRARFTFKIEQGKGS
jgi:hypothetical protein